MCVVLLTSLVAVLDALLVKQSSFLSSIASSPRTQEQVVLLLFLATLDPEKRKTLYEADGVPALIRLKRHGTRPNYRKSSALPQ
ncbi:hypothetical protein PF001_g18254 [Phytophthora fragariae]|uniref:Uncharacterized protein n=1 Tax=Phytophthora fragariae TaxID=53985 RepID=A0A6A4CM90_9STRA|nr:hypothetical protein PF001_g18254 [Phytophthora fragariae]